MFEYVDWQGSGGVRYVVPGGSGTNGMSWADALPSIQSALSLEDISIANFPPPDHVSDDYTAVGIKGILAVTPGIALCVIAPETKSCSVIKREGEEEIRDIRHEHERFGSGGVFARSAAKGAPSII